MRPTIDDGIVTGNLDLADILFLVAAIVLFVVAFVRLRTPDIGGTLIAVGAGFVALGLLVL